MTHFRENGAHHKFIRRMATGNEQRRYRYVYDPKRAVALPMAPSVGDKIRIAHGKRPGHYEVMRVLQRGEVVEVKHDESGHMMFIATDRLHDLLTDTYQDLPQGLEPADIIIARHLRQDRLPRAKWRVFDSIVEASGIDDTEFAAADRAYLRWRRGQGPKPKRRAGRGELDAFEDNMQRGRHFTSLREAFDHATRGAETWRDIVPALQRLRTVPGFEDARLPDEVIERHVEQDAELEGHDSAQETPSLDVEEYGVTIPVDDADFDEDFAVFDASTREAPRAARSVAMREPGQDDDEDERDIVEEIWGAVPNPPRRMRRW